MNNIFLLGICGTAMANLAVLLKQKGYHVWGWDKQCFNPMNTVLQKYNITVTHDEKSINYDNIDLAVIGNAISRGNTILETILNKRIEYTSQAALLYDIFMHDKERIVIAGTHGKTTTTSMLAHCLSQLEGEVSHFIGGMPIDKDSGASYSEDSKYFVLEGDEYDTVYYDKRSKFLSYRPHYLIATSLEYDHADIFNNIEEIKYSFQLLFREIPQNGIIVYNNEYNHLRELINKEQWARAISYGKHNADYIIEVRDYNKTNIIHNKQQYSITLNIAGTHNLENAAAVFALLHKLEYEAHAIIKALNSFKGVKRRLEIRKQKGNIIVIDDFAHHPTAIAEGIKTVKQWYKDYRIWAIFEPRSATSRRNIFEQAFAQSLSLADIAIVKNIHSTKGIAQPLNIQQLLSDIQKPSYYIASVEDLYKILQQYNLDREVFLFMSNGDWQGILEGFISLIDSGAL